jgi:hypothetical protein
MIMGSMRERPLSLKENKGENGIKKAANYIAAF